MRVCHVVEASGGGVGQVIIDLVRAGIAAGQDITVIYAIGRATPHFIQTLSPLLGIKLIPISMQREVGLHDISDAWGLYRCLKYVGPFDVIHGHSSKAGALVRIVGILFPHTVKVYSPHAFVTLDATAWRMYGAFEKILSWFSGTIVTLSAVERKHAVKDLWINPKKIVVVHNGIQLDYPADRASARQLMQYPDQDYLVGFVGRFVPQKNLLRLVDAFCIAAKENSSLQLALIGDGPLRQEMDALLAKAGMTDKVRYFSGYVGRDLMPALDCLVCASDYEGFPIIFLEALAAGVPIISTPVGGAQEAIIESETGFMVNDFKAESLADAMLEFARLSPEGRAQMSENAKKHAYNFSLERIAGQMQSLYTLLLNKIHK